MNSLIRISGRSTAVSQMSRLFKTPIIKRSLYKAAIPTITSVGADPCAHYTLKADYKFDVPTFKLHKDSPYQGSPIQFDSAIIRDITDRCWNSFNTETSYQPAYLSLAPFKLSKDDQKIIFQVSDLAYFGADKMHQKLFSRSLKMIDGDQFYRILYDCVHDYLSETDDGLKTKKAQSLNDAFIAIGWLEKYWLFEGFTQKKKANFVVPEVIAKPYSLLAVLFGNQTEFLYYGHYVGASCSNMQDMRDMMSQVDFENQDSIATWLKSFEALYDVQSEYNSTLGNESIDSVLQSDQTFRFIHLAMEMVFSRDITTIHSLFDQALLTTGAEQKQFIQDALDLMNQTEIDMHAIFKTLPKVSKPSHYNPFVRPFIAGTFGGNCGTVYHEKGKFFVGCGDDAYLDPNTAVLHKGKWKKHVGQTGAQTSARVILDMFQSLATNALDTPVDAELMSAIMMDDQAAIQHYIDQFYGDPLTLQLTIFRATCRPPNQNAQIVRARFKSRQLIDIILKDNDLTNCLIKGQVSALAHRVIHYLYVHNYINEHKAPTSQKRVIATGGTKTYDFLPQVTNHVLKAIRKSIGYLKNDSDRKEWERIILPYQNRSNAILSKTRIIAEQEAVIDNAALFGAESRRAF